MDSHSLVEASSELVGRAGWTAAIKKSFGRRTLGQEEIVLALAVCVFAVFSVALSGFLSLANIIGLLRNAAVLGILSVGMAVVVIGRGIDLAQTTTMTITSALAVVMLQHGLGTPAALGIGLLAAIAIGLFQGWVIAYIEIPPLFATLASALFINGLGRWAFLNGQQLAYVPKTAGSYLSIGQSQVAGVPVPIIVFAAVAIAIGSFLSRTTTGRHIYAQGDNMDAARLTGLNVRVLLLLEYTICAVVALIAGVVLSASSTVVNTQLVSTSLIFDVILVVVVSGVSLHGGRGRIRGVVMATLLIGILLNGLTMMDVNTDVQNIVKGILLLGAILLDNKLNPRDEETARQGDM